MSLCDKAPFGKDECKKACEKVCGLLDEVEKCGRTLLATKTTCGLKGEGCDACVEEGMAKLQDACGEKADRLAPLICTQKPDMDPLVQEEVEEDEEPDKCQKCMSLCDKAPFGKDECKKACEKVCGLLDEVEKCGRTLLATKTTCGLKGEGCDACVEEGMAKLQDACGEKA